MKSQVLFTAILSTWVSVASAQGLVDQRFTWDNLPYKADPSTGLARGDQVGYNRCNSTTEGPTSLCQTAIINSLDDFCLWAPPSPGRTVGEIEGEMVAWCTQPGHGARVMPDGTITGVQFTKSPDYVQVVGFMDQTKIYMVAGDAGGEMDPHGADNRGNPIGGLVFSNAFTGSYVQVIEWHNFNGGNAFCLKACDPSRPNGPAICQHMYDTQGCGFNAPSNAKDKVFESCASDTQNPPGQGPAVPPASSLCSTFASTAIYGPSASVTVPIPGASTISFSPISRPPRSTSTSKPPAPANTSSASTRPSATAKSAAIRLDVAPVGVMGFLLTLFMI